MRCCHFAVEAARSQLVARRRAGQTCRTPLLFFTLWLRLFRIPVNWINHYSAHHQSLDAINKRIFPDFRRIKTQIDAFFQKFCRPLAVDFLRFSPEVSIVCLASRCVHVIRKRCGCAKFDRGIEFHRK